MQRIQHAFSGLLTGLLLLGHLAQAQSTTTTTTTNGASTTVSTDKPKGMSKALKGGIIGGLGGAAAGGVLGRVIGGKSGTAKGAILGAALGGGAGVLIGRKMDKQAAELRRALDGAKVERVGEGIKITFASGILFGTNSATLTPAATGNIDEMAATLLKYADTNIVVEGHRCQRLERHQPAPEPAPRAGRSQRADGQGRGREPHHQHRLRLDPAGGRQHDRRRQIRQSPRGSGHLRE